MPQSRNSYVVEELKKATETGKNPFLEFYNDGNVRKLRFLLLLFRDKTEDRFELVMNLHAAGWEDDPSARPQQARFNTILKGIKGVEAVVRERLGTSKLAVTVGGDWNTFLSALPPTQGSWSIATGGWANGKGGTRHRGTIDGFLIQQ